MQSGLPETFTEKKDTKILRLRLGPAHCVCLGSSLLVILQTSWTTNFLVRFQALGSLTLLIYPPERYLSRLFDRLLRTSLWPP